MRFMEVPILDLTKAMLTFFSSEITRICYIFAETMKSITQTKNMQTIQKKMKNKIKNGRNSTKSKLEDILMLNS